MVERPLRIVFLGLTITSTRGNGHAAIYRGLVRELVLLGHDVLFLEHEKPGFAAHRDLPNPSYGRIAVYRDFTELHEHWGAEVRDADLVVVGSFVPLGIELGKWVVETARGLPAFYDLDTPLTLASLKRGDCGYLTRELARRYALYLSTTGGPTLRLLEEQYGVRMARALYCSVDPALHVPEAGATKWTLGYLGSWCEDRQPTLDRLLVGCARRHPDARFVVAGAGYPEDLSWPANVDRIEQVAPAERLAFTGLQAFTLTVARADRAALGWSPSVRLFEAAASGRPVMSDPWNGLAELFHLGEELLVARDAEDVWRLVSRLDESERAAIGERGRARVLASHTSVNRCYELLAAYRDATSA